MFACYTLTSPHW
ncbi:unnamed protein product [Larinioides sclopetarius]|uniref:Uncharacterized protein n=1 Tax=Larinioides sclopetarius TaxID=280406 RepID=A0AAV2ATP0_9ARAC